MPGALCAHDRVCRVDAVDDPAEVDPQGEIPLSLVELLVQAPDGDAGVVDHQVQPAMTGHRLVDEVTDRCCVADVDGGCGGQRPEVQGRALRLVGVEVRDDDAAAPVDETTGDGQADA